MAQNISTESKGAEALASVGDYEAYASQYLPKNAWDYYSSGATDMVTLRSNRAAFAEFAIRRRVSASGTAPDTSTTVLGSAVTSPVCAAATAMQCLSHPDGELGSVKGAARAGVAHVLSSLATNTIEDVASAAPDATRWFQLYVYTDRALTTSIIRRAEKAGYSAMVLTVDTPVLGRREADMRNGFTLPRHLSLGILKHAASRKHSQGVKSSKGESGLAEFVRENMDASLQWSDVAWLMRTTTLPVLLKGVMTAEDAKRAADMGVAGVIVSNHGARQLDSINATLHALPEIAAACRGKCPVFLDGGVRCGADAFKAIALGARAVFVGRPVLWGLAHSGEDGVAAVLALLAKEFAQAMRQAGCATVADIGPQCLELCRVPARTLQRALPLRLRTAAVEAALAAVAAPLRAKL